MDNNPMKDIGLRLTGLRESLDLTPEVFAQACHISLADYLAYEAGEKDLTLNVVKTIATRYNVDVSVLLFADEPRMSSYFLTRKGKGMAVKRVESYKYQTLAGGFNNRKAEIFEVTVEPSEYDVEAHMSKHTGQEFNLVLEGRMLLIVDGKELILNEGDSIYFDSNRPHGMKALDNKRVRFIAVIL